MIQQVSCFTLFCYLVGTKKVSFLLHSNAKLEHIVTYYLWWDKVLPYGVKHPEFMVASSSPGTSFTFLDLVPLCKVNGIKCTDNNFKWVTYVCSHIPLKITQVSEKLDNMQLLSISW